MSLLGKSQKALLALTLCGLGLVTAGPAMAETQCTITLNSIFSGDGGHIWIIYSNGGSAYLGPADPDRDATLSLAITALTTNRQMLVRYTADGVACNAGGRNDVIGVYLL